MSHETFPITLKDAVMLSPKARHLIFECHQDTPFNYLPGQFITIHFEQDNKMIRRSYSIANVPSQNNIIEIALGYVEHGPASDLLFNIQPGSTLQASGPYGRLILKDETPKRYILVATSTGITPYRAMIAELIQRMETFPELQIIILEGVQCRNEILYLDEWMALIAQYPQVTFRACLSQQDQSTLLDYEVSGYVQHVFPELNLNPEQDLVYLCGNPAMIDDAFSQLKDKGFTMSQIIREKYISR